MLNVSSESELCEQLEELAKTMPVLIFTSESRGAYLRSNMTFASLITADVSPEELRKCDEPKVDSFHRTMIVTDSLMLRGHDWRAESKGIALVID